MNKVCKDCGTVAEPKTATRGTLALEIILWLCFLVPGLIYSVWRLSTRYDACPSCGSANLVPVASPHGKQLAAQSGYVEEVRRPSSGAVDIGRALGQLVGRLKR